MASKPPAPTAGMPGVRPAGPGAQLHAQKPGSAPPHGVTPAGQTF